MATCPNCKNRMPVNAAHRCNNVVKVERVGESWGRVVDVKTNEVKYDGMSFSEAVEAADLLNGNDSESRRVYS